MAVRLAEIEPRDYHFVITPTGDELPDMLEHWKSLGERFGKPLTVVSAGVSLQGLIRRWGALPNFRQRWCTRVLKIEPFNEWIMAHSPATSYVGLRADEEDRKGITLGAGVDVTQRFPLREWGWGLSKVQSYLQEKDIKIPARTDCARCYHQQIGEWFDLHEKHPDIYADAEKEEAATGHTFRSPGRDTWPAELVQLRGEFESGRIPLARRQRELFDRPTMCRVCSL